MIDLEVIELLLKLKKRLNLLVIKSFYNTIAIIFDEPLFIIFVRV